MNIYDPITGEKLNIFACDNTETGEIYECTNEKIVAFVASHFRCDRTEAIRKLANSDINNPIIIGHEEFWVE